MSVDLAAVDSCGGNEGGIRFELLEFIGLLEIYTTFVNKLPRLIHCLRKTKCWAILRKVILKLFFHTQSRNFIDKGYMLFVCGTYYVRMFVYRDEYYNWPSNTHFSTLRRMLWDLSSSSVLLYFRITVEF
jgi:hypothetical protein